MGCFSGFLSGFFTWLITPVSHNWNSNENFQSILILAGLMCGFFMAFTAAIPVLVTERRFSKALRHWFSGASAGLSVSMLATVVFIIVSELLKLYSLLPASVMQFFWWFYFSIVLSACFGIMHSDFKIMCRAFMGLAPALIIGGSIANRCFKAPNYRLAYLLLIGIMAGFGFSLAYDLLKESWLDEEINRFVTFRYYIYAPEFLVGSGSDCDLSLKEGPENLFVITEKNGVHTIEACDNVGKEVFKLNNRNFRYRTLVDGDVIEIGRRVLVYHTKMSRTRGELPAAAG